jgi:predicted DNA-binding protein with PD1-like motif
VPSFYLDVQKDVVGCHLTGNSVQTLQEILITEDNLQDYKYKNIKTEDNNTNQIFLRMQ